MEAALAYLRAKGCTITPLSRTVPGAVVVGLAGRDVICFLEKRTPMMQKFADAWRGVPPVDLNSVHQAETLVLCILHGEFDADSKYQRDEIIRRLR
jgi:hypothetical protein